MKKHTVIKQEINDNRKKIQKLQELIKGKEQNEKMLIKAYEDKYNCSPFQARKEMKKLLALKKVNKRCLKENGNSRKF